MPLLSLRDISFTWSGPPLLDHVTIEIERGQRIGLLGRNGAGKSTLMKIIDRQVPPDDGQILHDPTLVVARLVQEVPAETTGTVEEIVAAGVTANSPHEHDWEAGHAVDQVLSRLKLDGSMRFESLSSGMKRRVLLAQALVNNPNILLLDEPTNHLDIQSISWLEGFLKNFEGTLVFVTHDRAFLQSLANRIIEIDRGQLFDWSCDYETFLHRKQLALDAEEKNNVNFDRKLAEEEVWIRKGIKARRVRNEGRVRALKALRVERSQRREKLGNVRMQAIDSERSGRLVIETKEMEFAYDGVPIIKPFSTLVSRGDKIGIIGPNGAGKTTLLKLLLGELQPTSGSIRHGTKLEVSYFDQLREQIDEEKSVVENVGEGQDILEINGRNQHVYGYLQNFLFTPERARRPARYLSGGERNRLLLARIFKHASNVLVLDEPTNDLDAETLELLEELVTNYEGTLLLVSHDRAFLNNVVTSTFVFDADGTVREYDGGYDDYVRQSAMSPAAEKPATTTATAKLESGRPAATKSEKASVAKKLTFKERSELDRLPDEIADLEARQKELHTSMSDPLFFKQPSLAVAKAAEELDELDKRIKSLTKRWEDLESRA